MVRSRPAFTLIELLLVITILAGISGMVVFSTRDHIDRARWNRGYDQIEHLDRMARITARTEGVPYRLTFSRSKGQVELRPSGSRSSKGKVRRWTLPSGLQYDGFRQSDSSNRVSDLKIDINASGQSLSYAVSIKSASGPPRWVVTLGLSGQQVPVEKAEDVTAMLRP